MCRFRRESSVRISAWNASWAIVTISGCLLLLSPFIVTSMMSRTRSLGWHTPSGSASLLAEEELKRAFPTRLQGGMVIAVEAKPETPGTVLTPEVANFSQRVADKLAEDSRVTAFKPMIVGYYLKTLDKTGPLHSLIQKELVSEDKRMTLLFIQPTAFGGSLANANEFLQEFCATPPPGCYVHITGMPAVLSGNGCYQNEQAKVNTRDMSFDQIERLESKTLIIPLIIIGRMVKFLRLLIIPVMLVCVTFVAACLFMIPFMGYVPVAHDVPAAMGSVLLALCLDYSLFFLSRFGESHFEGASLQDNVDDACREVGHTVTVSGTLVAIAFFGSMILPEDNLRGSGMAMGIAVVTGVIVSGCLIPSLLVIGGKGLAGTVLTRPNRPEIELTNSFENMDHGQDPEMAGTQNIYVRIMKHIAANPYGAVVKVMIFTSPLLFALPFLNVSGDSFALLPMGMPALRALNHIQDHFPVGVLDPYAVLITGPPPNEATNSTMLLAEMADSLQSYSDVSEALTGQPSLQNSEFSALKSLFGRSDAGKGQAVSEGALANADLHLSCGELAAIGAGAAYQAASAASLTGSEDSPPVAAFRAADAAGCDHATTQAALVAALGSQSPQQVEEVGAEALRLNWSKGAADDLKTSLGQGASEAAKDLSEATLKAAEVGRNAARNTLADEGTLNPSDISAAVGLLAPIARASEKIAQTSSSTPIGGRRLMAEVGAEATAPPQQPHHTPAWGTMKGAFSELGSAAGSGEDRLSLVLALTSAAEAFSKHGPLMMPSGFEAMLDLCEATLETGKVSSLMGPSWAYHQRIEWPAAVYLQANHSMHFGYRRLLDSHLVGNQALLEVHTKFASVGAGGANWVTKMRRVLSRWEEEHPGYTARISGGASQAVDTRAAVLRSMWSYLGLIVALIMFVVYLSFGSFMVPLRLALALLFTLAVTYGAAVFIYQTPLLHGIWPAIKPFDGLTFEVVPMVTGICIALGLDYDIFLVSRVVEYRKKGYSDQDSIFIGSSKAGSVITGAGIIMTGAFAGLWASDKLLMQQFGVLLVVSVLFDTFVVRTVLVPALMMMAQEWNWWPGRMPPVTKNLQGGGAESSGGHYRSLPDA